MDESDDFDYDELEGVVFDEEEGGTPERGLEEPQTGEVPAACPYGSDYESDDLATRSPSKKPKTDTRRKVGGRKKGMGVPKKRSKNDISNLAFLAPISA